jgi:hypothetical protein
MKRSSIMASLRAKHKSSRSSDLLRDVAVHYRQKYRITMPLYRARRRCLVGYLSNVEARISKGEIVDIDTICQVRKFLIYELVFMRQVLFNHKYRPGR